MNKIDYPERKDVPGYEGLYYVTNNGDVFSYEKTWICGANKRKHYKPESEIKKFINKDGYYNVILCKNGKPKNFKVQRLIAISFIPNPLNLHEVNHEDGNKLNNKPTNLKWCTRSGNLLHAYKNGLKEEKKGELNKRSKLTNEQAREIRASNLSGLALSKIYKVHSSVIYSIRNLKTYKQA